MRKYLIILIGTVFATAVQASLIDVTGGLSSAGAPAEIIGAPDAVLNGTVTNLGMQAFDEAQGVTTTLIYAVDGLGFIPPNTLVNSHMIFLNPPTTVSPIVHESVTWTFDGNIIGVMSDDFGALEASSSFELGAPGTQYLGPDGAPFANRGLDPGDSYTINGDELTVSMQSQSSFGDWIRVVTEVNDDPSAIPEPSTIALFGIGLAALGLRRWKRNS